MEDLTGRKYGSWTVLDKYEKRGHNWRWLCKCVCGKEKYVLADQLKSGRSKSCGCQRHNRRTHGMTDTSIYNIWYAMRERCRLKTSTVYKHYGGRGISVAPEWNRFETFYEWAMNNGYKEGLTIDRIDNDGNYEPSNCRWATMKEQCRNRRNSILITHNGETKSLPEWAEIFNVPYSRAIHRYKAGMPFERIFTKGVLHDKQAKGLYQHDCPDSDKAIS